MKRFRIAILICICIFTLQAKDILYPKETIIINANVISSLVDNDTLYLTTDNGTIELFDIKDNSYIKSITLDLIKAGFSDDLVPTRVSNVDVFNNGTKLLILSDDSEAGKALFVYEDDKLTKLFSYKDRLNISKAYFVDNQRIILGLLGNELLLYDLKKKEFIYRVQPYWAMLTDFQLSPDRKLAFIGAESGYVYIYSTDDGKRVKDLNLHKDIVLSTDFSSDTLISGGSDQKVNISFLSGRKGYSIDADFIVKSVGISPSGKLGAYVANESNIIYIFNIRTNKIIAQLHGGNRDKNTNNIIFLNEKEIIVSYNSNKILRWELP